MWSLVQVLPIKHNNFCLDVMNLKLSKGIAGNSVICATIDIIKKCNLTDYQLITPRMF